MRILIALVFTTLLAFSANGQTQCPTVEECNALVTELSKALQKTLDVNKANEALTIAQRQQIEAQERLIAVQSAVSKEQEKLIEWYRKQTCETTSFLFGVVKVKRCKP